MKNEKIRPRPLEDFDGMPAWVLACAQTGNVYYFESEEEAKEYAIQEDMPCFDIYLEKHPDGEEGPMELAPAKKKNE